MARKKYSDPAADIAAVFADEKIALLANAVYIDGVSAAAHRAIMRDLIMRGVVGYRPELDDFCRVFMSGEKDYYGDPAAPTPFTFSGKALDPVGAVIPIFANASRRPPVDIINSYAAAIGQAFIGLRQNLAAAPTAQMFKTRTQGGANAIEDALERRSRGEIAVAVDEDGDIYPALDLSTPFIGDALLRTIEALDNDISARCGLLRSTDFKAERTQSAEVSANASATLDLLYVLVDSFNAVMEEYGHKMHLNGTIAEYDPYEKEDEPDEST